MSHFWSEAPPQQAPQWSSQTSLAPRRQKPHFEPRSPICITVVTVLHVCRSADVAVAHPPPQGPLGET